jgi:hypothetical protein
MAVSGFRGKPFKNIEVLNGKKMQANPGFDHTILEGKCIVEANGGNPNIRNAIELKNCPPSPEEIVEAFKKAGVEGEIEAYFIYMRRLATKYKDKPEYDPRFYQLF